MPRIPRNNFLRLMVACGLFIMLVCTVFFWDYIAHQLDLSLRITQRDEHGNIVKELSLSDSLVRLLLFGGGRGPEVVVYLEETGTWLRLTRESVVALLLEAGVPQDVIDRNMSRIEGVLHMISVWQQDAAKGETLYQEKYTDLITADQWEAVKVRLLRGRIVKEETVEDAKEKLDNYVESLKSASRER